MTGTRFGSGALAISDPRVQTELHPDSYGVQDWNRPSKTVRSASRIMQSASSIADPRLNCSPRSGTFGVQDWSEPSKTIIGAGDIHASAAAVADPRILEDTERGVYIIIAEDGTWHRPITTFEMAMIQSFSQILPNGETFSIEGCSDAKSREYIGNAVPPLAAQEIASVMLVSLIASSTGDFHMSYDEVWVQPEDGTADNFIMDWENQWSNRLQMIQAQVDIQ